LIFDLRLTQGIRETARIPSCLKQNTGIMLFLYHASDFTIGVPLDLGEEKMTCFRCSNPMFYQKFYGTEEHYSGWKCIFCGEVLDQVILENRCRGKNRMACLAQMGLKE
jgi:hypothetical protein